MELRTFEWFGQPRGQGRPRKGKWGMYKASEDKSYEQQIAMAYMLRHRNAQPFTGGVIVRLTVLMPIPKSYSKRMREACHNGEKLPLCKPDVDNAVKAVLDALNGVAYLDDKQVTECHVTKKYGEYPGLYIEIEGGYENEEV